MISNASDHTGFYNLEKFFKQFVVVIQNTHVNDIIFKGTFEGLDGELLLFHFGFELFHNFFFQIIQFLNDNFSLFLMLGIFLNTNRFDYSIDVSQKVFIIFLLHFGIKFAEKRNFFAHLLRYHVEE